MSSTHQNQTVGAILTRTECEHILANIYTNSKVQPRLKHFEVIPELKTVGFLGQYFHLVLYYEQAVEKCNTQAARVKRLFVKTLPYENAELCRYIRKKGILKKEATLYATLLEELQRFSSSAWCAQCYYIRDDLFVLQDLEEMGYSPISAQPGYFHSNDVRQLLQSLAVMHASSIAYEFHTKLNIGEVFKDVLQEITVSAKEDYFTTGLKAVLAIAKQHPAYQDTAQQAYIETDLVRELKAVFQMVNPSNKYRNVFCHRDPWGGNIFFRKKETNQDMEHLDVMMVDFQTCRYSPPAIDVIFVLNMNISVAQRQAEESEYLAWYYKCLKIALSHFDIPPEEQLSWLELNTAYQDFQLFGVLYKAIAATIIRVPQGYLSSMKLQSPKKYYNYAYVDRTSEVLKVMADYVEFREYMHECVADIMAVLGKITSGSESVSFNSVS